MNYVGITKFDPKDKLHQELAEVSKTLHRLKAKNDLQKITQLEKQNEDLVKRLFEI
ncbi:hypothetical protein HKBW3S25_01189 [Candidatus Hakubella thermalkaliphila]|nr:hypothetical protein HKBW3S25_01189 [Candidatus Hakubella thermalkaliphila]